MLLVILWLIQDFFTVLCGGSMQIPGLFIMGIIYKILFADDNADGNLWAIWSAFAGGILWDLRWIGIPGFFTLGNVIVVLIVIQIWGALPPHGRKTGTGFLVFVLFELSQLVPPLLPVLILGGDSGWSLYLLRQAYAFPIVLLTIYFYLKNLNKLNL
ncbi:MAG: hypothetical protein SPL10_03405 [Synergistales bacterium]|nr:hypothetical protein [Synergistales bacterium]MDY6402204.1 hypothetical protein [Synergistales bacterium]MDY6404152.1 hypothetical protein [Synergistales bacterium]MDY6409772.1 hypothetical protein [Synergistales bacterium]MDY6414189.1 hypothetical protein [Synergistales bacterium]